MRPSHTMRRAPKRTARDDERGGASAARGERRARHARRWLLTLSFGLGLVASIVSPSHADLAPPRPAPQRPPRFILELEPKRSPPGPDASTSDPVVASVGSVEVRAGELAFLLGRLHEFERQSYGDTPEAVKRGFLERRLIPELLAQAEAQRTGVERKPAVAARISKQLVEALKDSIQREVDATLTEADIREYCQSEGGSKSAAPDQARRCDGDLSGYRVALRRTRASRELGSLDAKLAKSVRGRDDGLLARVSVGATGVVSAATSPGGEKPESAK